MKVKLLQDVGSLHMDSFAINEHFNSPSVNLCDWH